MYIVHVHVHVHVQVHVTSVADEPAIDVRVACRSTARVASIHAVPVNGSLPPELRLTHSPPLRRHFVVLGCEAEP